VPVGKKSRSGTGCCVITYYNHHCLEGLKCRLVAVLQRLYQRHRDVDTRRSIVPSSRGVQVPASAITASRVVNSRLYAST
jgi:hypothetical protein